MTALLQAANAAFPAVVADGVKAAVEETLASICGARPAVAAHDGDFSRGAGVIGIVSFLGDVSWSFSLCLPEETAPALVRQFAGFDISFDSPDMCDVVGELANVVAGDIVARLEARRVKAQMSLPMVARGSDVEVLSPTGSPAARFTCRIPQGPFWYKLVAAKAGALPGRRPGT
jgi:CheY-specific phosphatase CheX